MFTKLTQTIEMESYNKLRNKYINELIPEYCQTDVEFYHFYNTIRQEVEFITPRILDSLIKDKYIFTCNNADKLFKLFHDKYLVSNKEYVIYFKYIIYSNVLDWWNIKCYDNYRDHIELVTKKDDIIAVLNKNRLYKSIIFNP